MYEKSKYLILQAAIVLAYVGMVIVNVLAVALPLNGVTTQQVAEKYDNLFAPAGITFSIWGVIYALLLMFVIYSVWKLNRPKEAEELGLVKIGWLFVGTCVANSSWLFAWHYEAIFISVVIMMVLLKLLFKIYLSIPRNLTRIQYVFLKLPFSIYLGWITVALAANITVLLAAGTPGRPGAELWTVTMMILAIWLALVFIGEYDDIAYALVIAWALIGILIKHRTVFEGQYVFIQITAYLGIGIILANGIYSLLQRGQSKNLKAKTNK